MYAIIGTIPLFKPKTGIKKKLCNLKYTPNTAAAVEENPIKIRFIPYVITEPIDPIIIEGTPTLYTFLKKLCNTGNNIITIEDPVEYSIKGVNQVQVNNKMGITFASCLRSILRQDPNIIMIGEIRDEETAEIAIRASITGHLVFSTLHTNDSFTAITRLIDMKVPSYLVSEGIIGVISQRLVRRLCDYCKEETYLSSEESDKYFLNPNKKIYKEVGCSFCNNTGYIGRVAAYEILEIDSGLKRLIVNDSLKEDYEKYINFESSNEFISISDSAKDLLYKGVSSLEEI